MSRIAWSQSALADFARAISYIAERDASAARLVAGRIDRAVRQLAEMPTGRPGRVHGTYEKPVLRTPYIVAYAVDERGITILHVIHGRRDWREGEWPA